MSQEKKKKIMIVEDDKFIAEVYTTKLVSEGFDVTVAENGEDALKAMKEDSPELILLDILMPKLNGIEVLERMKKDDDLEKIEVIILTNASEKDFVARATRIGAIDYLIKSNYTPDEVVSKIKEKLGN